MEQITVHIGAITIGLAGQNDERLEVAFAGEELGQHIKHAEDPGRPDRISKTNSITTTLYRTDDGRLVAHISTRSPDQVDESLIEVDEEDLLPGGSFYALGKECGLSHPLTLDEALEIQLKW